MPGTSRTKCDRLPEALEAPVFNFSQRQRQEGSDPSRTPAGGTRQQNGALALLAQNVLLPTTKTRKKRKKEVKMWLKFKFSLLLC